MKEAKEVPGRRRSDYKHPKGTPSSPLCQMAHMTTESATSARLVQNSESSLLSRILELRNKPGTPEEKAELARQWRVLRAMSFRRKTMNFGLDIGTKNIVLSYREKEGKIRHRHDINGFCYLNKDDAFARNLLDQQGIPFLERERQFIALGQKAEDLAYAFNHTLLRPMSDGVINGDEEEALLIMSAIIRGILADVSKNSVLYYCIPGNALNMKINVKYHQKIIQLIVNSFDKVKIESFPINEARALVLSQVKDKTAIGISWGAGMVNVCYCLYGISVFEFSLVGSGDWVDAESARVVRGETPTSICRHKENRIKGKNFKLSEMPSDTVGRAIYINYGILMENVIKGFVAGFKSNENRARIDRPIPIVIGGGTSSPEGFTEYFQQVLNKQEVPFEIGDICRADPVLFAVADGCLHAAEMHESKPV